HGYVGKARKEQHEAAVQRRNRRAAQHLSEQDHRARHWRDQHFAQEAELAVPDHRDGKLDRRVHDVEHNDGGEQELQVGVWDDVVHLAIDLAPEIGVEPDAKDQQPDQRAADAADQLAAVACGAHDLAQPDAIDAPQENGELAHRRSPRPLATLPGSARSRSSRPVSERNTLSSVGSRWRTSMIFPSNVPFLNISGSALSAGTTMLRTPMTCASG